jgi:pimeloyl-ACP methyl ester carboxylesterase
VNLIGHSLGGNVAGVYAGLRPQRVRRAVSIDGFGVPAEGPNRAPKKLEAWLERNGQGRASVRYRLRDWLFSR